MARRGVARVASGVRRALPVGRPGLAHVPGELPASDVPASIELTDRMTAYTRPINWLGWPSAVTADGVMHTGRDEAALLSHALAWEANL